MTNTGIDFQTYAGDSFTELVTATKADGTPVDLSTAADIVLTAYRNWGDAAPALTLKKSLGGITFPGSGTDGKYNIVMGAVTATLSGYYFFLVAMFDGSVPPKQVTITQGRFQVGPPPTWTYSGNPENSPRDAVRLYIRDTTETTPLFFDQEIDKFLLDYGGPLYAASAAALALSLQYAGRASKRVGDLSISYSDISKQYATLATQLRAAGDIQGSSGSIYTAGISKSDMKSYRDTPDAVGAFTRMHQFDNRGAAGGFIAPNISADDEG